MAAAGGLAGMSLDNVRQHCKLLPPAVSRRSFAERYERRRQTSQDCADRLGYRNENKAHLFAPDDDMWAARLMRYINTTWPHVEHSLTNVGRSAQALDQFLNADCMTELCPHQHVNLVIIESQAIPLNGAMLEAVMRFWATRPRAPALISLTVPRLGGWNAVGELYAAVEDCLNEVRGLRVLRDTLGRVASEFPQCAAAFLVANGTFASETEPSPAAAVGVLAHYGVPDFDVRRAMRALVHTKEGVPLNNVLSAAALYKTICRDTACHPTWLGKQLLGEGLIGVLQQARVFYTAMRTVYRDDTDPVNAALAEEDAVARLIAGHVAVPCASLDDGWKDSFCRWLAPRRCFGPADTNPAMSDTPVENEAWLGITAPASDADAAIEQLKASFGGMPVVESDGFEFRVLKAKGPVIVKAALAADTAGASVTFEIDTAFKGEARAAGGAAVSVALLVLQRRTGTGKARVACVQGCTCTGQTINGYLDTAGSIWRSYSLTDVTPAQRCRLHMQVLEESDTEGHEFMIQYMSVQSELPLSSVDVACS